MRIEGHQVQHEGLSGCGVRGNFVRRGMGSSVALDVDVHDIIECWAVVTPNQVSKSHTGDDLALETMCACKRLPSVGRRGTPAGRHGCDECRDQFLGSCPAVHQFKV